jgi:hypothetical protein
MTIAKWFFFIGAAILGCNIEFEAYTKEAERNK